MLTVFLSAALAASDGGVGLSVEFAPGALADPGAAGAAAVEDPLLSGPTKDSDAGAVYYPPEALPDGGVTLGAHAIPFDADAGFEEVDAGEPPSPVKIRGAAEAEVAVLPSGYGANGMDAFAVLRPVASFAVGEDFSVELGPTFRLRVVDTGPDNDDFGGVLRRPDWDEGSDFGQLIQSLRIAPDSSPFYVRGGFLRKKTLGHGHLINRYTNQGSEDYHPAYGNVVLVLGPVRSEFFVSDILGGRLFAGDVTLDLGRVFSSSPEVKDRYLVSFQIAHDAARAGLPYRPDPNMDRIAMRQVTLLQVDGSAVVLRNSTLRLMLVAGFGTRVDERADIGFELGAAVDATVKELGISAKVEARRQGGGFRQGYFGPTYELSRFSDVGFSSAPQADALLPGNFSFYGEFKLAVGTAATIEVAAEYFLYDRTDLDSTLNLNLLGSWLVGQARFSAIGLGQASRYHLNLGLRARLFKSFYLMGSGGTAFFPQPDGSLVRGVTASAGVGVDFER